MNDFNKDYKWQMGVRDAFLVPYFYEEYITDGRYVLLDKGRFSTILQKRYDVDTVVQGKNGEAIFIEEKIVRWPEKKGIPHTAFALETHSCTIPDHESPGWMEYGQADYLFYCYMQKDQKSLICYLIDFKRLQDWFWPIHEKFNVFQMDRRNKTLGRLVPIADVRKHVRCHKFHLEAKEENHENHTSGELEPA